MGMNISWFDDDGHVRGNLNLWIFQIKHTPIKLNLHFVECSTHKIHEMKCPINKMLSQYVLVKL